MVAVVVDVTAFLLLLVLLALQVLPQPVDGFLLTRVALLRGLAIHAKPRCFVRAPKPPQDPPGSLAAPVAPSVGGLRARHGRLGALQRVPEHSVRVLEPLLEHLHGGLDVVRVVLVGLPAQLRPPVVHQASAAEQQVRGVRERAHDVRREQQLERHGVPSDHLQRHRAHRHHRARATQPKRLLTLVRGEETLAAGEHAEHVALSRALVQRVDERHREYDGQEVERDGRDERVRRHPLGHLAPVSLVVALKLAALAVHRRRRVHHRGYRAGQEQRGVDGVVLHLGAQPAAHLRDAVEHQQRRPARRVLAVV